VQSNQESRRALEDYIKTFDIRRFPGEDVTAASLRIKAVARSLGTNNLPSDILHRVLEGFSHASTLMFQSFCATQETLITSSLVRDRLNNKHTLYKMLVDVLTDLEVRYTDLRSGQRWFGQGNGSTTVDSAFISSGTYETFDDPESGEDDDAYAVYINTVGRPKALPFDIWVRDKNCHHCGEKGHIRPQCPNRQKEPSPRHSSYRQGHTRSKHYGATGHNGKSTPQNVTPLQQRKSMNYPTDSKQYAKKVLTAALDMVDADDSTATNEHVFSVEDTSHQDKSVAILTASTPAASDSNSDGSTSKYSAFLAALGCPKE
jgi:hypothetical protein